MEETGKPHIFRECEGERDLWQQWPSSPCALLRGLGTTEREKGGGESLCFYRDEKLLEGGNATRVTRRRRSLRLPLALAANRLALREGEY